MRKRIRPLHVLIALAGLAAFAVAAQMALAHGGDPTAIHACLDKDGKTRIIAAPGIGDPNQLCKSSETAVDWNQTGPPGPAGAAGPTTFVQGTGQVINFSTMLTHTVTADEAGLNVVIATVELLDRDPNAGGATSVGCHVGGLQSPNEPADVATLVDTGDPSFLHRDRETITLIGRGTLNGGDTLFVGCESFAGDDDEATGTAQLLLEHVSG